MRKCGEKERRCRRRGRRRRRRKERTLAKLYNARENWVPMLTNILDSTLDLRSHDYSALFPYLPGEQQYH